MIIIDASIAVKWFVEEQGRDRAEAILNQIKGRPTDFAVPEFFYIEMMSVLSRLLESKTQLDQTTQDRFDLGLVQIRVGAKLLTAAGQIAMAYKLSGYDSIYYLGAYIGYTLCFKKSSDELRILLNCDQV